MEDLELNALWKEYDRKLEESRMLNLQAWAVNHQTFEWLQTSKARSRLKPMGVFKGWAVFLGVVWALFLGVLLIGNHGKNPYFTVSVAIILLFTLYAIVAYLRQMALIRQIDYTDNVLETQQKLSQLQASTLRTTRILFLQTPFYSTWFWSDRLIGDNSAGFWGISVPVAVLLSLASLWIYRNCTLANSGRKWFRFLFKGIEWTPILRAMEYLREIEEFRDR
jgi:glucan phosphoethanolaminetransferase (alkaline phosphatase superfamily)